MFGLQRTVLPPLPLPLVLLLLAGALGAQAAPRFFVFTWQGDTSTTLCVNFQSLGEKPLPATVRWDTEPRGGRAADYRFEATGRAFRIDGLADRWFYRVPLTGLTAGGTVHLVAGDRELGISREYAVRTIADDGRRLRFVTGGDMGTSADTRTLLRHAAKQDPDFVLLGGDIAYANGDVANVARWDTWLTYWTEEMVRSDGCCVPLGVAIGNHEVRGGYGQPPSHAPFFFALFGQDEQSHCVRRFGPSLAAWLLDSGHVEPHGGRQASWLARTLEEFADVPHKIAVYHIPIWPTHRLHDGPGSLEGRTHWAPLFDAFGLDIAFENHDHTWKRSMRLRGGEAHADGVLYLGDGCFGQAPRRVDYGGRWYVQQQGGIQHFWCVDVDGSGMTCRAFDLDGEVFDVWPETAAGADAAAARLAAKPRLLQFPSGTAHIGDLAAGEEPWQRGETTLTLRNTFGHPCDITVDLERGPTGAVLDVDPPQLADGRAAAPLPPGESARVGLRLAVPQPIARADVRFRIRIRCRVHAPEGPIDTVEVHTVTTARR